MIVNLVSKEPLSNVSWSCHLIYENSWQFFSSINMKAVWLNFCGKVGWFPPPVLRFNDIIKQLAAELDQIEKRKKYLN